jgi:ABC-type amino acid transport substrate-binding protein
MLAFVTTLTILTTPLGAAELSGTLKQIQDSGTVRIGYRQSEPPMSFDDKDGKPVGYSIDLCMRIIRGVNKTLGRSDIAVKFVPVTAKTRFTALTNNEIDILCGATTMTLSRREFVDFTQLTFATGAALLSLEKSKISGVADLQGKKVAVVENTTTIDALKGALKESLTEAEIIPVASAADAVKSLLSGEIDAFSSDQIVLVGLLLTSKETSKVKFSLSGEIFSFEPFALAVRRNDADFRLVADRVLSHLYRSGQVAPIYGKWFGRFSKTVPSTLQALYGLNATPK